jgi:hypothetical protein
MPQASYDKLAIARLQLETALQLFRDGKDLFSVITLAGAAEEILGNLLKEQGQGNAYEALEGAAAAMYRHMFGEEVGAKQFAKRANRARNALKHHDPGHPRTVTLDLLEEATDMLDRAVANYWRLEHNTIPGMDAFASYQRAV